VNTVDLFLFVMALNRKHGYSFLNGIRFIIYLIVIIACSYLMF